MAQLRVHFYGTQGSGSIFPSRADRAAVQARYDQELLQRGFEDMARIAAAEGGLPATVEALIGGPIDRRTLARYRARFDVPEPRVYGGWTTCVHVETADGHDIVFDCGSGFRNCARELQAKWGDRAERHLHLFGSHSHLDHTEGFDQAAVCFDPRNHLHIYGNRQFLRALDLNLGIFSRHVDRAIQGVQTPIFYGIMPATFHGRVLGSAASEASPEQPALNVPTHDLAEPVRIGATTVTAFEVHHPAPCLAYRVEHGGKVLVFCTDHELWRGSPDHASGVPSRAAEDRLRALADGADLLYRDAQYLRAEYDGEKGIGSSVPIPRAGWGHSCIEDVIEMATECGVGRALLGHHDPNRDWAERNWLDESMARRTSGARTQIEFARAETTYEL
jgi:ribonuclease BN (tRNA processing enzyme)